MSVRRFLLPDSLSGRMITAMLIVVCVTVAILALLIMRERREVTFWGNDSSGVIGLMAQTSEDLAGLSASERKARLDQLRREPLLATEGERRQDVQSGPQGGRHTLP